jgi:glycogen debranching enzyme
LGRKATQKKKGTDYEAEDNVLKGLEGFAQTLLKIEETRSQTLLKLESDRADRELTMMKWKEEAEERRAKEKRESDEIIAAQNMAFQLEIQKLKAQLKSGPGGSST